MIKKLLSVFLLSGASFNVFGSDLYIYSNALENSFGIGSPPHGGLTSVLTSYKYSVIKDENTSFGAGGGYRINDKFSFEFGYNDLGQSIATETISKYGVEGVSISKITSNWSQLQASVLTYLPVSNSLKLYGRLGVTKITENSQMEIEERNYSYNMATKISRNCALISLGSMFDLTEKVKIRLEYTHFNADNAYHPKANVSAGFVYIL